MQELKGSELKKLRSARNIPLEQVASQTHIRLSILQDLEEDAYSELSSAAQARGFLKIYAEYLGVKPGEPEAEPAPPPSPPTEQPSADQPPDAQPIAKQPVEMPRVEPRRVSLPWRGSVSPKDPGIAPDTLTSDDTEVASKSESGKLLEAIGRELSARRRYLNIGWDVIQDQIHISKPQLQILERGDLDALTNPMQYKGLLQAYVRFLNLDVESVMIRFADALQKRREETAGTKRRSRKAGRVLPPVLVSLKRFFTLDLFFGTLLILGILSFLVWGIARMSAATKAPQLTGTLPAVAEILLSEPTEATPSPGAPTPASDAQTIPTVTPFFSGVVSDKPIEIVLLARQNVWLRVTADGNIVFQGRMIDGTVQSFTANESLELETGNVLALEIMHNQNRLEPFSDHLGEAAKLIFTLEGTQQLPIVSPEMQITPTSILGDTP